MLTPGMLRRLIGAPLLLLLTACYTWQEIQPAELAVRAPDEVRIMLTDGTRRTLTDPRLIESDSVILGFAKDPDSSPVGLAITEIRAIEVREANELVTVLMVVGTIIVAFVVPAVITVPRN